MLKVISIHVILKKVGMDDVCLTLDAPDTSKGDKATAVVHVSRGKGLEWAKNAFPGFDIEVTDMIAGACKTFKFKDPKEV